MVENDSKKLGWLDGVLEPVLGSVSNVAKTWNEVSGLFKNKSELDPNTKPVPNTSIDDIDTAMKHEEKTGMSPLMIFGIIAISMVLIMTFFAFARKIFN